MKNIKILAIDCSLRLTCAALSGGGSFALDLGRAQAAELPVKVEELLKNSGLSFSDINYIALANGPGYFTGIRVGAAYAAGLAFALGINIIPVNSLEALANNFNNFNLNKNLLAIAYAGHGFVYAKSFNLENNLQLGQYDAEVIKNFVNNNKDLNIISDDPERALNALNLKLDCECVKPDAKGLIKAALNKIDFAVRPEELRIEYCKSAI